MNDPDALLQPLLKDSAHRFLSQYRAGAADFSDFSAIFSRFLHNSPDPPLEIVWFYSALAFHSPKTHNDHVVSPDPLGRAKDLFQVLVSCSSTLNATKRIAVFAPVVCELYSLALQRNDFRTEIDGLLEGIVSYISISCGGRCFYVGDEGSGLGSGFWDLVRIWVVEKVGENSNFGEQLRVLVPIVSDGVREVITREGGCRIGYLAGIVMAEVFLLRLCLKFWSGMARAKLGKEMHSWAVQIITAFRSYHFREILLKMLLEPVLPVISLVNCEGELLLREVLYDAVITMEYSFLHPEGNRPTSDSKNFALTWLFVADSAIRFARENDDQNKVRSYIQAFSESCLPSELIKWVTDQTTMQSLTSIPNVTTPIALINWLLMVEDQGVNVFDSDLSKIYARAIICRSRTDEPLLCKSDSHNRKVEDECHGDLEMVDSTDNRILGASKSVELTATNGTRKRKEGGKNEDVKQAKLVKCHLNDISGMENILTSGDDEDDLSNGSEVDYEVRDEDAEYMEQ